MEYIKNININEAVIHILDNESGEPLLTELYLELSEETYMFLLRHIERCLKDEELKYAVFNEEDGIVKKTSQDYLNGQNNLMDASKEMAGNMYSLMKENGKIPSCDLFIVSFSTEYSPMLAIIKMDYIKSFIHKIDYVDNKLDINIVPQFTGLPVSSQRIMKCAFIKPINKSDNFNLMVIDKQSKYKNNGDTKSNYFTEDFLNCTLIENERDATKNLIKTTENWTRNNLQEDADTAEKVRSAMKKQLRDQETINIELVSEDLFKDKPEIQKSFIEYAKVQGVSSNVTVDKEWVDKRLKRIRLKIDKDIDVYINEEAYNDDAKFEIKRNGDGSINMVIKHVMNYIEK